MPDQPAPWNPQRHSIGSAISASPQGRAATASARKRAARAISLVIRNARYDLSAAIKAHFERPGCGYPSGQDVISQTTVFPRNNSSF
jgi:hypothetical protein